jgi:hypothetical protein
MAVAVDGIIVGLGAGALVAGRGLALLAVVGVSTTFGVFMLQAPKITIKAPSKTNRLNMVISIEPRNGH